MNSQATGNQICNKCGNVVVFRHIHGALVPIHPSGPCDARNTRKSNVSNLDSYRNFLTNCPLCYEKVFFIRHNGGAVWLDPPLGSPWNVHPCFKSEDKTQHITKPSELNDEGNAFQYNQNSGTVRWAHHHIVADETQCIVEAGHTGTHYLIIRDDATALLDQFCEIDRAKKRISPFGSSSSFEILRSKRAKRENTFCHVCKAVVHRSVYLKHLKKHHPESLT